MTAAAVLLDRLHDLGVTARADGDALRLRPASAVPPELLAELKQHKVELLALLAANDTDLLAAVLGAGGDPDPRVQVESLTWAQQQALSGWPGYAGDPVALPTTDTEQAADEAADRAAIEAVDGSGEPGRWKLVDHMRHAAILRGLQAAALQRPPSWPDPEATPSAGTWCSCCRGSRWWREADAPKGWRCLLCHPPVPGTAAVEVRT